MWTRTDLASTLEKILDRTLSAIETASGTDILSIKDMLHSDLASTLEQALINLTRVDLASALEKVIHAGYFVSDYASAFEVRLSPVPLIKSDLASGIGTL